MADDTEASATPKEVRGWNNIHIHFVDQIMSSSLIP